MAEMGKENEELSEDAMRSATPVADLIAHFEMLTSEKMKKALDGAKLSLKNKEKEERVAGKVAKVEVKMSEAIGAPPEDVVLFLNGNSREDCRVREEV